MLAIIETLPSLQQTILRLRHIEGMEMKDIAELIGTNEVAIRKALSRARQAVRTQYMKRYER
jgi:RNA polymerase sigma-70 factor (ECF subfamily)